MAKNELNIHIPYSKRVKIKKENQVKILFIALNLHSKNVCVGKCSTSVVISLESI